MTYATDWSDCDEARAWATQSSSASLLASGRDGPACSNGLGYGKGMIAKTAKVMKSSEKNDIAKVKRPRLPRPEVWKVTFMTVVKRLTWASNWLAF